ncbi:MAG: dTMP kinase [Methylophilaceae bacterium]|nr:dTMP kinase [Methylophilaceae bacterium]
MLKGKFITLEGVDGAGKSTHIPFIAKLIRSRGVELVLTREPGGTAVGEQLRDLLLREHMSPETETLVMFAARCEHLKQVICPALERGCWVLSDRFTDASFAYQHGGRGVSQQKIEILEQWVQEGLQPDLTLLFDVPVDVCRARLNESRDPDRFERENQTFFERVRHAYLQRARDFPPRIRVIDANRPLDEIHKELEEIILSI